LENVLSGVAIEIGNVVNAFNKNNKHENKSELQLLNVSTAVLERAF